MKRKLLAALMVLTLLCWNSSAQTDIRGIEKSLENTASYLTNLDHRLDILEKKTDDLLWYNKVGDLAEIDKVFLYGPPLRKEQEPNPTAQGAGNPVKMWAYVFVPKTIDITRKHPLIVFAHGGVHANFDTYYSHIVRELMAQQYVVIAPEYRGSTGYGKSFYEKIDYGGLESEDADYCRKYMIENCEFIDRQRIGIIGWSHGGLNSLNCIFDHPNEYKVAYAGVPVSDLVARMGYKTQDYQELFSADYHIGKTAFEDVEEYRRRSPAWNASKLNTPLLIHTNTNDEDVNVLEVEHLIKSLKAEGKKFEYKVYQDLPGGHSFNRMDTKTAREIRLEIYNFLYPYLQPAVKFKTLKQMEKSSYKF
jgi:dipeptidyl aminopeptidase/acylaminoacyl peptidase